MGIHRAQKSNRACPLYGDIGAGPEGGRYKIIKTVSFWDTHYVCYNDRLNEILENIQRNGGVIKDIRQTYCGGDREKTYVYVLALIIYEETAGEKKI